MGTDEQQFMQIVNRDGAAGFVSMTDRSYQISSYSRWEQAFRVYSDVYTGRYPNRATELIQYNHTIHTASLSYVWDNVYTYDIEFRKHMFLHLNRNWGIILNMAWTMCVKDRISHPKFQSMAKGNNRPSPTEMKQRKPCNDFNKGKCTYGKRCKFDHRCGFCSKFGHGTQICRKFLATQGGDAMKIKGETDK